MTDLESVESICPFCAVGCSVAYDHDTDRAGGRPGAANPNGRLCPKGIRAYDPLDRNDRLTTPMVRSGGRLRDATWDEALAAAADGLSDVRDESGGDALAFLGAPHCTNEENYLFAKLARLLGTNNVDNRARICHASTAAAMRERLGCDAMTNSLEDLTDADAFLVVGANPAARQPVAFDTAVRPAVNAGASLIHIDPRATETTRLADYHLAPHPGRDVALLCGMAAEIVAAGLADQGFIDTRTSGFEAYAARLQDLDPDALATAAGVDPGALRAAARTFAEADRATVICGTGIEASDHETTHTADALLNLVLLTGNLGRRGTGMNLFRGLNNEQGAVDMGCRPFMLPGGAPVTEAEARARVREVWGVAPPANPGRSELDLVRAFGQTVHGAWVFGENPAVSTLPVDVEARLNALDMLVVQDTFHTETVDCADVVLPASAWAEKGGTVTNLDRQVQRMRPARDPPGQSRRDLRILCEMGRRLTVEPFDYAGPREVFQELTRVAPPYGGMSFDDVAAGGQRWPYPDGAESGVTILHRDTYATGATRTPFRVVPHAAGDGPTDGLVLLGGRGVGEFGGVFESETQRVQLNPRDADDHGIPDGQPVELSTGDVHVEGVAEVTTEVRPGIVYAHASIVDQLGAGETVTVQVSRS